MDNQIKLKGLTETRAAKQSEYKAIMDGNPTLTTEHRATLDALSKEIDTIAGDITLVTRALDIEKEQARLAANVAGAGVTNPEDNAIRSFSLISFLRGATSKEGISGFELEMHQEAVKEMRNAECSPSENGYGIPDFVLKNFTRNAAFKRAQSAGTTTEGGYAVQTDVNALIPAFYPRPIVAEMGATVLTGLVGNQSWPRDTALFSMAWESEISASDDTSKVLAQVTMSPKRMAGRADVSRRLLAQTSLDVEAWMQSEFIVAVNSTLDAAAINGSGASNQPTGILNTTGIGDVAGGTNGAVPTWANIVNLEKEIFMNNADEGTLGYLTTPGMRAILKQTLKNATYGTNGYIMENDGTMNGYTVKTSTNVPKTLTKGNISVAHAILFGNFKDLMVGKWGGVWILADPYTQATTSQVRIHTELQCDVAVRRAKSFSAMKDAINGLSS